MENVDERDGMGFTSLIKACSEGNLDLVKSLIEKGADIEAKNNDGRTALMWACENGFIEIVGFLIRTGANLNAKDNQGLTAVCSAAANGHFAVVKLLVENGANIRLKINDTVLAIAEAQKGGYEQIVHYLEEKLESMPVSGNCDLHKTMKAVTYCKECGNLMCEKCNSLAESWCPTCVLKFGNNDVFYLQEWLQYTKFSLKLSTIMWGVVFVSFILYYIDDMFWHLHWGEAFVVVSLIALIIAGVVLPSHLEHNPELIAKVDTNNCEWYIRLIPFVIKGAFYVVASPILIIVFLVAYKEKKKELENGFARKASLEAVIAEAN